MAAMAGYNMSTADYTRFAQETMNKVLIDKLGLAKAP